MSRRTKIASAATIILVIAAFFFEYDWTREWNTGTGKERTVHFVSGFRVVAGSSRSTELSEWVGDSSESDQWVRVASGTSGGPLDGALVNYCYPRILGHLKMLGRFIGEDALRHQYASWILSEVAAGTPICVIRTRCESVGEAIWRLDHDLEHDPLKLDDLRELWDETK